jgi:glycosyltransferase involved in cell wall biosynthesis
VRRWLRGRFGLWPLHEVRTKALRWPGALRAAWVERREVARLRALVGPRRARVVTVIPTWNRPELLARAVESALAQDVADHAVVVVHDGPGLRGAPDDPRVVAVELSRHVGHSGLVRNVGLGVVDSEVAAFLDDDNTWRRDHLSLALAALDDADLAYTALERVLPDGRVMDVLSVPWDRALMRERSFVDTNAIVVRRGPGVRFSRIRRRRGVKPPVDWEFVWRTSRRRRVVHVPEATVRYTVNPGSYFHRWDALDDAGPRAGSPADTPADAAR